MGRSATRHVSVRTTAASNRALVVEDDAKIGLTFKRIIEGAGVPADLAHSKSEAIWQLERHSYDVAVVDIMLSDDPSDRGGIEVIRRLSEISAWTAIVVVSQTADVHVPVEAFRLGAVSYLTKTEIRSSEDILAPVFEALGIDPPQKPVDAPTSDSTRKLFPRKKVAPLARVDIRTRFERLAKAWEAHSEHMASPAEMAMLPPYQEIIGMGSPVLPLILRRLETKPDHWFWALRAIAGTNPVGPDDAGNIERMAEVWSEWGRKKGLLR